MRFAIRAPAAAAVFVASVTGPAASQAPPASALARLQPGLWEIRDSADERVLHASVCLGDPALLVQARHGPRRCGHETVSDNGREATVRYSCPSAGTGRTQIRVETPRLAQVDSQGLLQGSPFAFRGEARRVGPCQPGR